MKQTHTPAPWGITPADYSGEPIRVTKHEDHPQGDLTICHCNPHLDTESEANARLIASAPDLLHALEYMLDRSECESDRKVARAAISKAKEEA
jgi:hypothetical protein